MHIVKTKYFMERRGIHIRALLSYSVISNIGSIGKLSYCMRMGDLNLFALFVGCCLNFCGTLMTLMHLRMLVNLHLNDSNAAGCSHY
jgi:hypothetical protein